jgi:L-lactate dehydrogenase complex protein LldG
MQTFKTSKSRENILAKIRKGLSEASLPMPFPEVEKQATHTAFAPQGLSAEETFAQNFIQLGGKFIFCDNEQDLLDNIFSLYEGRGWQQLLCAEPRLQQLFDNNKLNMVHAADPKIEDAEACITGCELLVARTGSVFISSKQHYGRTTPVFYPVHIIVAYANQVVGDIADGINALKEKYGTNLPSMINLNTGPSRTADIEKTLVVGVHGPGEVFCFYVNA